MSKILIVEDDVALSMTMEHWLKSERYVVEIVHDGRESLERIRHYPFDVIILDWELPGMSGIEVCQQYRDGGGNVPILMLTGKNAVAEKRTGLDAGADDYLTKPFDMVELSARIRALLRRAAPQKKNVLKARNIELDPVAGLVTKDGKEIPLQPKEFCLLEFFLRNPGEVFSAETILDRVWSSESDVVHHSIRPYINRVRAKIDTAGEPSMIRTVHGFGYRFEP